MPPASRVCLAAVLVVAAAAGVTTPAPYFSAADVEGSVRTLLVDEAGWLFAAVDPCHIVRFRLDDFERTGMVDCGVGKIVRASALREPMAFYATVRSRSADLGMTEVFTLDTAAMQIIDRLPLPGFPWVSALALDAATELLYAVGSDGWVLKLQTAPQLAVLASLDLQLTPAAPSVREQWVGAGWSLVLHNGLLFAADPDPDRALLHMISTDSMAVVETFGVGAALCSLAMDPIAGVLWAGVCTDPGIFLKIAVSQLPVASVAGDHFSAPCALPVHAVLDSATGALIFACHDEPNYLRVVDVHTMDARPDLAFTPWWGEQVPDALALYSRGGMLIVGFRSGTITRYALGTRVVVDRQSDSAGVMPGGTMAQMLLPHPTQDVVYAVCSSKPAMVLKLSRGDGSIARVNGIPYDYGRVAAAALDAGMALLYLGCSGTAADEVGSIVALRADTLAIVSRFLLEAGEGAVQTLVVHTGLRHAFVGVVNAGNEAWLLRYRLTDGVRLSTLLIGSYIGFSDSAIDQAAGIAWWLIAPTPEAFAFALVMNLTTFEPAGAQELPVLNGDTLAIQVLHTGTVIVAASNGLMAVLRAAGDAVTAINAVELQESPYRPRVLLTHSSGTRAVLATAQGDLLELSVPDFEVLTQVASVDAHACAMTGPTTVWCLSRSPFPQSLRAYTVDSYEPVLGRYLWPTETEGSTISVAVADEYAVIFSGAGMATRVRLSDFSHAGSLFLNPQSGAVGRDGHPYVYYASKTDPRVSLVQVLLSELRVTSATYVDTGPLLPTMLINNAATDLWVASARRGDGVAIRLRLRPFYVQVAAALNTTILNLALDELHGTLLCITASAAADDGTVALSVVALGAMSLSPMAGPLALADGTFQRVYEDARAAVVDASCTHLYICSYPYSDTLQDSRLLVVHLPTFSFVGSARVPRTQVVSPNALFNNPLDGLTYLLAQEDFVSGTRRVDRLQPSPPAVVGNTTFVLPSSAVISVLAPQSQAPFLLLGLSAVSSGVDVTGGAPAPFLRFDLRSMAVSDSLELAPAVGEGWFRGVVALPDARGSVENGSILVATGVPPGAVIRIRLSDMQRIETLPLPPGEERFSCAVYDPATQLLFLGAASPIGALVRVRANATSLSRVDSVSSGPTDGRILSAVLDVPRGYVYIGMSSDPAFVLRVNTTSLTSDASVLFGSGEVGAATAAIDPEGRYLMVATGGPPPARIVRIRLSDFTRAQTLLLPYVCGSLRSVVVDARSRLSYWGCGTSPGRVVVVNTTNLQMVGTPVALQPGENGARLLQLDASAGFLYVGADVEAGVIAQLQLPSLTRITTSLLPAPAGRLASILQVGSALVLGTDTTPGRLFKLFVTPAVPTIHSIGGGPNMQTPAAWLCSGVPGVSLGASAFSCSFEADSVQFTGSFEGSFVAAGRVNATFTLAAVLMLSDDIPRRWLSVTPLALPSAPVTIPLQGCEADAVNVCNASLPTQLSALARGAARAASGNDTRRLAAALLHATASRDGHTSEPHLLLVVLNAPALLSVTPAVIAQHGATLTVEAALPSGTTSGDWQVWLQAISGNPGVGNVSVPCQISAVSADGQTLTCSAPRLEQRMLGLGFDVVLTRAGSAAPVATLQSAVQFAWPVLSLVRPTDFLPLDAAAGSDASVVVLQSAAFAAPTSAVCLMDVPRFTAWIGDSPCANVTASGFSADIISCVAPSGVGRGVPITVEVGGCFNVTSAEAVGSGVVSAFDGQKEVAPVAARGRTVTTASYTVPTLTGLDPAQLVIPSLSSAALASNLSFRLQADSALPSAAILVARFGAGLVNTSCSRAALATEVLCSVALSALAAALPRNAVGDVSGTNSLFVSFACRMPGWPADTQVSAISSLSVVVSGAPVVTSVAPASGPSLTNITITGSAFAPAIVGDAATVSVLVAGTPCSSVVVFSDTTIRCTIPRFNATVMASAAAPIRVATAVGISDGAVAFGYEQELVIDWAANASAAAAPASSAVVGLAGVAPLWPVPAVRVIVGSALQCQLDVESAVPFDAAQTPVTVASSGRAVAVPNAGTGDLGFPELALVSTPFVGFTAQLQASCLDSRRVAVLALSSRTWAVAAPAVLWADETATAVDALAGIFIVPSISETPVIQAVLSLHGLQVWPPGAPPLSSLCTCQATLAETRNRITQTLGQWAGVFSNNTITSSTGVSTAITFPGLDFRAVPLGAVATVSTWCKWLPTGHVLEPGQPLAFAMVAASLRWASLPPATVESQQPFEPTPAVAVDSNAPPATKLPIECRMDAVVTDGAAGNAGDSFVAGGAASDSLVIPQTLSDAWNATLAFNRFVIAGRRQAHYAVSVSCTLGSAVLPPLIAAVQIAGCPPGKQPGGATGWLCNDCETGTYSDGTVCVGCPTAGASCGGGRLQLLQGFYRPPSQAGNPLTAASELHPCFNTEACVVNATSREYECAAPAYAAAGPLCGVCAPGYSMFGQVCSECWPAWGSNLLLTALVLVTLAIAAYLAAKHKPGSRSPAAIAFRQLTGFVQMVSVVAAVRVSPSLRALLGWTDLSNASILSFGPFSCVMQLTFVGRYLLTLALPLGFACVVALLAAAFSHGLISRRLAASATVPSGATKRQSWAASVSPLQRAGGSSWRLRLGGLGHKARTIDAPDGGDTTVVSNPVLHAGVAGGRAIVAPVAPAAKPPTILARPHAVTDHPTAGVSSLAANPANPDTGPVSTRARIASVLLMLTTLFYMPLLSASVRALDCYERPVDGVSYLRADLRVVCGADGHAGVRVVAIAVIVLLTVVLPAFLIGSLCKLRGKHGALKANNLVGLSSGHSSNHTSSRPQRLDLVQLLRPLYDGYDGQRGLLWYEALVFVRKAVLTIAGTLIDEPSSAAGTLAVVLLAATFLQASLHPYEDPAFNTSEAAAVWAATAVATLATLLIGRENDFAAAAVVGLVVAIASTALLFLLWRFLCNLRRSATAGTVRKALTSLRRLPVRMPSLRSQRAVVESRPSTVVPMPRAMSRRAAVLTALSTEPRRPLETARGVVPDGWLDTRRLHHAPTSELRRLAFPSQSTRGRRGTFSRK